MTSYVVVALDHGPHPNPLRDDLRAAHGEYVLDNKENILMVGPLLDDGGFQNGSLYVFDVENVQQIYDWLDAEPFYIGSLFEQVIVRQLNVSANSLELKEWP